jgi:hypothetical protein
MDFDESPAQQRRLLVQSKGMHPELLYPSDRHLEAAFGSEGPRYLAVPAGL